MRSNLSLFRSRIDAVPGPDNRLDQQPPGTLNLGADYRFRGTPLTIGGSLNLTPAYRTQLGVAEEVNVSRRRQFDAFALWVFNPNLQLRVNATNLGPEDFTNGRLVQIGDLRERSSTVSTTFVNWRVGLEMKL